MIRFNLMVLGIVALITGVAAQAAQIGIASGETNGTNWSMVNDIMRVCSTPAMQIRNVVSDGSLDNLYKITQDKTVHFGVVQADALAYQKGFDPRMMDRIQMVFPFLSTEIHLVARAGSNIRTLNDLVGKRVVEGQEGSGTWVTAQVIKALTGKTWNGMLATPQDGVNGVLAGQVDAMFIVAGKPVDLLMKTPGLKLVPINDPALDKFGLYTKTMLSSGTYPGQTAAVPTYKIENVLATYAFKNQYQREIEQLVKCTTRNLGGLQQIGHSKWRDVDPLDIERIRWAVHPAALAAINREVRRNVKGIPPEKPPKSEVQSSIPGGAASVATTSSAPQPGHNMTGSSRRAWESVHVKDMALAWPVKGPIVQEFRPGDNRGIGIGGHAGDPVRAAADGRVEYVGTGLNGYGNLIIVRHNGDFITAYARNQKSLVKIGDVVKQGEVIAEMGALDGTLAAVLFEVRRDGKPVDPMSYLRSN